MKKIILLTTATALLSSCGIYNKYQPATTTPDNLYGEEVIAIWIGGNSLQTRCYNPSSNKGCKTTPICNRPNCAWKKQMPP